MVWWSDEVVTQEYPDVSTTTPECTEEEEQEQDQPPPLKVERKQRPGLGIFTRKDNGADDLEDEDDDLSLVDEWESRPIRLLFWEDKDLYSVITCIYGSVWPRVLPFCCVNVIWTLVIFYLKSNRDIDLTVNHSGHTYLSALMSFVLVTRLKITFEDYMSNSKHLSGLNRACQDLVANVCLLTSNETSKRAKQWRQDVTYSVLIMLRVAIGVLEFRSNKENPWLLAEMANENGEEVEKYSFKVQENNHEDDEIQKSILKSELLAKNSSVRRYDDAVLNMAQCNRDHTTDHDDDQELMDMPALKQRLAHVKDSERDPLEESSRCVYNLALNARREILKQRDGTWFKSRDAVWQHPCNEETRLLDFVGVFLKNFSGLNRKITTPMPLPLVQITKTLLFVWLFTMPMCLCKVKMNHFMNIPITICIVVFFITFGFLGIEFVSVELADSFGNDPSDFDDLGQAQMTMEDCYISIYRQDGKAWAKALRKRVKPRDLFSVDSPILPSPLSPMDHEKADNKQEEQFVFKDEISPKTHVA